VAASAAGWRAHLSLHYTRDGDRTLALDLHSGPLRVLQRLYPEGPGICHHVLVHPPGGVVGGDVLELDARLDEGTHAVLTTPGATRFYRSDGPAALQSATVALAPGARIEWLPMESIAHRGCIAQNRLQLSVAAGAEAMGWDLLALGLPASGDQFDSGQYLQHLEVRDAWLERGLVDAADQRLLHSPLGLAGRRVLATMWFTAGTALAPARRDALLDAARAELASDPLRPQAGATAAHPRVVVLRVLADSVEPAMALLRRVRTAWRALAWQLQSHPPRLWQT
jgi:urease accessory protein